jgi:hypothetical protein
LHKTFLKSVFKKEGKYWSEFYKYVILRKGNRESIPAIKDSNGRIMTHSIEKVDSFNFYYSTVFSSESSIPHIQVENTGELFNIDIKIVRRIGAISRVKPCLWRN